MYFAITTTPSAQTPTLLILRGINTRDMPGELAAARELRMA
jgi:hypothetical protein